MLGEWLVLLVVVGVVSWRFVRWLGRLDGRGAAIRRGCPISAYVGPNGGGKSLAMIHDTLPTLDGVRWECSEPSHAHTREGVTSGLRRVLSTVALLDLGPDDSVLDRARRRDHPLYDKLVRWQQFVEATHCDILLDEVTGVAGARGVGLPPQMLQMIVQLRRADVVVRYTTPNWARTDVVLREVTQSVTVCRGFFAKKIPGLMWPSRRLFRWSSYDAQDWDEVSMERISRAKPLLVDWYWRVGRVAMDTYSTHNAVSILDHVSESGPCLICDGTRVRGRCLGHGTGEGGPGDPRGAAPAGPRSPVRSHPVRSGGS